MGLLRLKVEGVRLGSKRVSNKSECASQQAFFVFGKA